MVFAIIDFPHAVNTENLVYAIDVMLDQTAVVVAATGQELPQADVYLVAEDLSFVPWAQDTHFVLWPLLRERASAGKPVIALGDAVAFFVAEGLLPGKILENMGKLFVDKEISVTSCGQDSVVNNQTELGEVLFLPLATEAGRWCLEESQADLRLFGFLDEGEEVCGVNVPLESVAGACSADRRFVGLLFNPERAVDDEMGNTDGLKIFWSVMHHNGSY